MIISWYLGPILSGSSVVGPRPPKRQVVEPRFLKKVGVSTFWPFSGAGSWDVALGSPSGGYRASSQEI